MEGKRGPGNKKVWKNKRRKSLYNLECSDIGLLYRKLDVDNRRVTRSTTKRLKLESVERERNIPSSSSISSESTTEEQDFTSCSVSNEREQDATENVGGTHMTVSSIASPPITVNPVSSEIQEPISSDSESTLLTEEKMIVNQYCKHFILDLKKDLMDNGPEDMDEDKVDQALCTLEESLISSGLFQKALDEPVVLISQDMNKLKEIQKRQESNLKIVSNDLEQWKRIADELADEEEAVDQLYGEDHFFTLEESRKHLSTEQQEILDDTLGKTSETDKIEAAIPLTDQVVTNLRQQVIDQALAFNSMLDEEENELATKAIQNTPRTLVQQLKKVSTQL